MTAVVYPTFDTEQHASAAPPSAPPVQTSIAIEMPEKEIREEQKKTLIDNNNFVKDRVYVVPAPLPPDHPSYRTNRRLRRRSCCCCCLISFVGTLATIVILVALAALIIYLVARPKVPRFAIEELTAKQFNLTSLNGNFYVSTEMDLSLEARNPNTKLGFYYDGTYVDLYYAGQVIAQGSIPDFYQGHESTVLLNLTLDGVNSSLTSSIGSSLQSSLQDDDSSVSFQTLAISNIRVKWGFAKFGTFIVHVDCSLNVTNPTVGHVSLLSTFCTAKAKLRFTHITF